MTAKAWEQFQATMSGVGKDKIICFESENSPMDEMSIGRRFEIMADIAWQVVGNIKLRSV